MSICGLLHHSGTDNQKDQLMVYLTLTKMFSLPTDLSDIMNKILVITVFVALLRLSKYSRGQKF